MAVSNNTRSQEFKKMEESIKSMVREMLYENNKVLLDSITKQDQAIIDLSKKHDQSMTLTMNEIRALMNSSNSQVKLASIHLEGRALQWHQTFIKNRGELGEPPWDDYVRAIKCRFGVRAYEDPMADLKMLVQIGSVSDYLEEFDVLSHKLFFEWIKGGVENPYSNVESHQCTTSLCSSSDARFIFTGH
ncbi:conserved hypothetical protein [Ricinus communis]|uniref:Retrotransposon gag domain-containing protein n=1 Tax=Ricinus communis TaxID=3988 RepID=B9RLF3_RICCO|nr:conserved hypothetical protein [Ricinus communis]